jgi:hypothetical protein
MSQRCVETVIGRLATDEAFRQRFQEDRASVLSELAADGVRLTPVERQALLDLDSSTLERFAEDLDPRIQKVCLWRRS